MSEPPSRDPASRDVLGPAVAGTWYPADPTALSANLEDLLRQASSTEDAEEERSERRTVGLIAPHAGFVYSGPVAASAFRGLRGWSFRRVLLLGPSHYARFRGAVLPSARRFRTPLGEVELDDHAIAKLGGRPEIRLDSTPFLPEHCLEAEIPFLQHCLDPGWTLVPVLLGIESTSGSLARIASALGDLIDEETLVVVSSDFTHYGRRFGYVPFEDEVPRRLRELDMGAVERILALDRGGFQSYVERTGATICGRHAVDVLLGLLADDARGELLDYDTSGNLTGDWSHTVSYVALRFEARAAGKSARAGPERADA